MNPSVQRMKHLDKLRSTLSTYTACYLTKMRPHTLPGMLVKALEPVIDQAILEYNKLSESLQLMLEADPGQWAKKFAEIIVEEWDRSLVQGDMTRSEDIMRHAVDAAFYGMWIIEDRIDEQVREPRQEDIA